MTLNDHHSDEVNLSTSWENPTSIRQAGTLLLFLICQNYLWQIVPNCLEKSQRRRNLKRPPLNKGTVQKVGMGEETQYDG